MTLLNVRQPPPLTFSVIQQGARAHCKLIGAIAIATTIAYFVVGKFALIVLAGSLLFTYVYRGTVYRVLNRFELKGVVLAVAAAALPFVGGPVAWVGGAFAGISILTLNWQHVVVEANLIERSVDLEALSKTHKEQRDALIAHAKNMNELVTRLTGQNRELQAAANLEQQNSEAVEDAREICAKTEAALIDLQTRITEFATQKSSVIERIQRNAELDREYLSKSQLLSSLEAQIAALEIQLREFGLKDQALTREYAAQVQQLDVQVGRITDAMGHMV